MTTNHEAVYKFYSQTGGSLPYFAGIPQQYGGGGILRNIAKFAFPLVKRVIGAFTNTAEDVLEGRDTFKKSIINNATNEVGKVFSNFSGRGRKRTRGQGRVVANRRKPTKTSTVKRRKIEPDNLSEQAGDESY